MRTHRNTKSTNSTSRLLAVGAVLSLTLTACGGDGTDDPATAEDPTATETAAPADDADGPSDADTGMDDVSDDGTTSDDMSDDMADDDMDMDDGMEMSGDYGEPADASEADRVIEVNVDNDLAFEPAEFEVAAGEVVTFRISNTGDVEHEFVLGDEEAQNEMAEMMESGDDHAHSGDMSNAVTIHAGETAELTWRFPSTAGSVLIGCHVPGHYEAGMKGTVTVTG